MNNYMIKVNANCYVNRFWVLFCEKDEYGEAIVSVGRPGGTGGTHDAKSDCPFEEMIERLKQ